MAKTTLTLLTLALLLLLLSTPAHSTSPPAIYVFGDSAVDAGNNNFLDIEIKSNFAPYGIDYPGGVATGRFTNGLTFADFISQWFGLMLIPPIMDGHSTQGANTKGFNYASAAAGLLPKTCEVTKNPMSMGKQVELFTKTVNEYLPSLPMYKDKAALSSDLSKSFFLVHMGSNDYMLNYFDPNFSTAKEHNPEQFADLLVTELGKSLEELSNLGARKFIVFGIGLLGCTPVVIDKMKVETKCAESVNEAVKIFNTKLEAKLVQLCSTLKGSTFTMGNPYNLGREVMDNPGFKETRKPCCGSGDGKGPCSRNQVPCQDRTAYKFWDFTHPTQATHELLAKKCFDGTGVCTPLNLIELMQKI
ncbi:GDSL esterase/lipase At5g08460-like [Cornus florida]|uniref:GDSL esterase/lipase At5g08460-like n=1 Tax=Cornus florida TaxID=4283 RepID=UPI0028A01D9E|nr:GDSL esterase/lipase At5g08460-like [Cornus florida]